MPPSKRCTGSAFHLYATPHVWCGTQPEQKPCHRSDRGTSGAMNAHWSVASGWTMSCKSVRTQSKSKLYVHPPLLQSDPLPPGYPCKSVFQWVGQALFLVQAVLAPQPHLLSPPPLHPPPGALLWVVLEKLAAFSCRWPHGIAVFYYGWRLCHSGGSWVLVPPDGDACGQWGKRQCWTDGGTPHTVVLASALP